jgi:hypothetical protein
MRWALAIRLGLVCCALTPLDGDAACTARERIDLRREGYTKEEVERICADEVEDKRAQVPRSPRSTPPSGSGAATICSTPVGACFMMQPVPVGSYCTCFTAAGSYPGVAQ